jgi:hypothetical protein
MEVDVEMLAEVKDPFLRDERNDRSPSASDADPS